jgi:uncharacterized membrane protein
VKNARFADEHGLVGVSLIRWGLVIVLLGLVVIEGGSIIFTKIGLQNTADAAAIEAADIWEESHNIDAAKAAALEVLDEQNQDDAVIPAAKFQADGAPTYEVRFEVVKQAATLIVQRIDFLKDLGEVRVQAKARPVEPGV